MFPLGGRKYGGDCESQVMNQSLTDVNYMRVEATSESPKLIYLFDLDLNITVSRS
jgi:hypothetical protein